MPLVRGVRSPRPDGDPQALLVVALVVALVVVVPLLLLLLVVVAPPATWEVAVAPTLPRAAPLASLTTRAPVDVSRGIGAATLNGLVARMAEVVLAAALPITFAGLPPADDAGADPAFAERGSCPAALLPPRNDTRCAAGGLAKSAEPGGVRGVPAPTSSRVRLATPLSWTRPSGLPWCVTRGGDAGAPAAALVEELSARTPHAPRGARAACST